MKKIKLKKVFIHINGEYQEIPLKEHLIRRETDEEYQQKKFIGLHSMIMEVSESDYIAFYREKRREKYLEECANKRGDLSYDALTTDEFNGENIVIVPGDDLFEAVWRSIMLDKLQLVVPLLADDEKELIYTLFFTDMSEREYAAKQGVSQVAIHKRKIKILEKLKKLLEN